MNCIKFRPEKRKSKSPDVYFKHLQDCSLPVELKKLQGSKQPKERQNLFCRFILCDAKENRY